MLGKYPKFIIASWLVMLALFSNQSWAMVLTGELDKVRGTTEDTFIYTLTVEGDYQGRIEFPSIEGLEVREGRRSSSMQMFNGRVTQRVELSFYLSPERPGTFQIPAITLNLNGKQHSTLPLQIEVAEPSSQPQAAQDRMFFVERLVSQQELYVGEPLIVTDRIYMRTRLLEANYRRNNFPDVFRILDSPEERRFQQQLNGGTYTVVEHQALLLAARPGNITMPPTSLEASYADPEQRQRRPSFFDDFMGRQQLRKARSRSEAHELVIKPLPVEGRSIDFSGLVGSFDIEATVDRRSLRYGEQLELVIRVFGSGITEGMKDPETNFSEKLRVYPGRPESTDRIVGEKLQGERIFRYTLLPVDSGTIDLGVLNIQFFDPSSGRYEWRREALGSISVESTGAQESLAGPQTRPSREEPEVQREKPQQLARDIRELRAIIQVERLHRPDGTILLAISGFGISGLIFGIAAWVRRGWSSTANARQSYFRRTNAGKRALQSLKHLQAEADPEALGTRLNLILRQYLSDRILDDRVLNLSTSNLEELLASNGASEVVQLRFRAILLDAQRLSYSSARALTVDHQTLLKGFEMLLRELESIRLSPCIPDEEAAR